MPETQRQAHPNFIKYANFITKHPNYKGLFFEKNSDGSIRRVVTGKSKEGLKRRERWDKQCKKHGIVIEAGCYKKIADLIHPTKVHTCQICGKELSIYYVYPTQNLIKKLNKIGLSMEPYSLDIYQIVDKATDEQLLSLAQIFKYEGNKNKEGLKLFIKKHYVDKNSKMLSPGVMSNSPDRFDGFHSDGACCRSESDKGRHKDNLTRYAQDRRVYENRSDGDWKMADRLMGEFRNHNVSPDHIGPISLGFCHRPKFNPMTQSQNSSKNNRMSLSDVQELISDEKKGEMVISWHSKYIWDKVKFQVNSDNDALMASKTLRENLHNVLTLFSMINQVGYGAYLIRYLNLKYSYYDYKFIGFNAEKGTYKEVKQIRLDNQNQKNNAERYLRIAFERLEEYRKKDNRKLGLIETKEMKDMFKRIIKNIKDNRLEEANKEILKYISTVGNILLDKYGFK